MLQVWWCSGVEASLDIFQLCILTASKQEVWNVNPVEPVTFSVL